MDDNEAAVTAISFEYGTTTAYGSSATTTPSSISGSQGSTAVSAALTGLTCNTHYYFRLIADGTRDSGSDFVSGPCTTGPTVTTSAATGLSADGATLNGSVTDVGANVTITFEYGADTSYGTTVSPDTNASISATQGTPQTVSPAKTLTGLTCNTTYHYRIKATDGVLKTGSDQTFTTSGCVSGLTLNTPTVISTSASLATFEFQANADATLYFNVIASSGTCPSAAVIHANTDANRLYWGSAPLTANTPATYTLRNLTGSASYKLCATVYDGSAYSSVQGRTFSTQTAMDLSAAGIVWERMGAQGFSPISANAIIKMAMAPDGTPYIVTAGYTNDWQYVLNGGLTVKRWNNTTQSWISLGTSQTPPSGTTFTVQAINLAFAPDGAPYLLALAKSSSCSYLLVKKWDGAAWTDLTPAVTPLCGAGAQIHNAILAFGPDSRPYIAYKKTVSGAIKINVIQLEISGGASDWASVGTDISASTSAHNALSLAFAPDGTPYIALSEYASSSFTFRVYKFTTSWVRVGTSDISRRKLLDNDAFGINQGGIPFIAVNDEDTNNMAVHQFDGTTWESIGSLQTGSPSDLMKLVIAPSGWPVVGLIDSASGGTDGKVYHYNGSAWNGIGATVTSSFVTQGNLRQFYVALNPQGTPLFGHADSSASSKATVLQAIPPGPRVTTGAATGATLTGATLNGTVNPSGFAVSSIAFEYGSTTSYGTTAAATPASLAASAASTAVSATITGLSGVCNTGYHARLNATRDDNSTVVSGSDATFATSACTTGPSVTTSAASLVTGTGATLNGSVTDVGLNVTSIQFEYGTAAGSYGTAVNASTTITATPGTPQTVTPTKALTGLTCNTKYYYRIKATDATQTNNGSEQSFTTSPCTTGPSVTTSAATSVTGAGATLNGAVTDVGLNVTSIQFEYGAATGSYGTAVDASATAITATPGTPQTLNPTKALTGLTCNTTYYYRIKAIDATRTNNGSELSFTTTADCNAAPVASSVQIAGTATAGQILTGSYTYSDTESDPQSGSTFRWLSNATNTTTGATAISGATGTTYVITPADRAKYLFYCITPAASSGTSPGTEVCSAGRQIADSEVTWIVTTAADPGTVGGCISTPTTACSLRDAIVSASTTVSDTILISPSLSGQTITLTTSSATTLNTLTIDKNLSIYGLAANITIAGQPNVSGRLFSIGSGKSFLINNLTLANSGSLPAFDGGGILNQGTLFLQNVTFSNHLVPFSSSGAGLLNLGGTVQIIGCTFKNNEALSGGAIANLANGTLAIINSTFSGNRATSTSPGSGKGGAIWNQSGSVTLINSTLVENQTANSAAGGGIANESEQTFTLINTLLAGNTASSLAHNCAGTLSDDGHNLDTGTSCGFAATGSLNNIDATSVLLGTLDYYGGPTQTVPLLPGSVALDAGDATTCGTIPKDQRGTDRIIGTSCDIGAFESKGFTLTPVTGSTPQSATVSTAFTNTLGVTVASVATTPPEPVNGGRVTFTAPGTGASATLATSPATIASGAASVNVTANATAGAYSVTAGARGVATDASFSLTNTAAGPVNGVCGSANGQPLTSAPSGAALCSSGNATTVSGSGPWSWSCAGSGGGITASCSASLKTWSVTGSAGTGGSISPASQSVNHNARASFAVTPATGYGIASVSGCGGSLSGSLYTTGPITDNTCTVSASFSQNAVAGVCGSDHGKALASLNSTSPTLCTTGAVSGFNGTGPWTWSCTGTGGGVTASCAATTSHNVNASAGTGGGISPVGRTVNHGGVTSFTLTPNAGYAINLAVGGTCGGTLSGNLFTTNAVNADCTVTANFTATNTTTTIDTVTPTGRVASSPSVIGEAVTVTYSVTGPAGFNGTVTVSDQDGTTCSDAVTTAGTSATGSCQLTFATAGAKTLIATYSGTVNASASSGTNHLVADAPSLATPSLNSGVVGVPYAMQLVASGGHVTTATPYRFNATGLLAGFSLSTSGLLSGTGSAPGTSSVVITVTDALNQTSPPQTLPLSLVNQLTVATTSLPDGLVNAHYEQTLEAVGGQTPYAWSLASGSLPAGLSLDAATGKLSGTPTDLGASAPFTIRVTDAANRTADQALTLTTVAPTTVETGTVGTTQVTVSGNLTPEGGGATCALDDEQTLVLNVGDAGAPGTAPPSTILPYGLFKLTVQGCTPGQTRLTVRLVYPAALSEGTRYWKYGKTADNLADHWYVLPTAVIEGNTISFTLTDGGLGDDDLSANGSITDPGGPGGPVLGIGGAPGNGQVGSAYSAALSATSGTGPYNWSLAAGGLPPGIALNATSGALSGTPTLAGTFTFSVQLVDTGNGNTTVTNAYSVTIAAAGGGGPSPVNGACGSAHNGLFYDLPTSASALCASGTPSAVSGSGPWTWSCLGSNGGSAASCRANLATAATYTVTTSASVGGTISPAARVVKAGATTTFTLTPATGYALSSVSGCGGTLNGTTYTTGVITGACIVTATFSPRQYTVTASAGPGGTIAPASRRVSHGLTASFTLTPADGYAIDQVSGCGGRLSGTTYTTAPVTAACTVTARFAVTSTWLGLVGDWDGDGTVTAGLYDPVSGRFALRNANRTGAADSVFRYGPMNAGWWPLAGDWNGDGVTTVGLYDPLSGTFYLRNAHTPGVADVAFRYGPRNAGWYPLAGDWNHDGIDTVGLYDPHTGVFFLRNTHTPGVADQHFRYGPLDPGWIPLVGDWNGDGTTTIGLYDGLAGLVYLRQTNTPGVANVIFRYGPVDNDWWPLAGGWNGDGADSIGLFKPATESFYLRDSNTAGMAEYPDENGFRITVP
ncbi:choice-of-anchor U domain-containing protein [Thiobaca trueperi]|uniref:choice-of-anchor U domain-containing protein n=1 Tax=Thiobaca trueperi TaxID=127458 RepID=UPI001FB230FB|nr:choice-of-anchor U domain-containing protein [Thiobaca trueperi]